VAFSPDPRFLAAGHEKGLKIWEAFGEEKSASLSRPKEHSVPLQLLSEPVAAQEVGRATRGTDEETWLQSVPYLPPDTEILVSLNVRKLLKSELGMKYAL